jgi:hypothetical protein
MIASHFYAWSGRTGSRVRVHRRERRRPGGAAQKATAEEKDVAEITKRTQRAPGDRQGVEGESPQQ